MIKTEKKTLSVNKEAIERVSSKKIPKSLSHIKDLTKHFESRIPSFK